MSAFSLSLRGGTGPLAGLDIGAGRVAGVALDDRGGRPVITAHAVEQLPDGALVPALNALNIKDRAAVSDAVGRVLERIGRPKRIGLVVGDPVAKVSQIKLQQVPAKAQDLDQVIRWQVRKSAPFAIEDAQIGYEAGFKADDGQDFIVTLARRDVIVEYEELCAAASAHAGVVDISTFNVVNAALLSGTNTRGDWLLVNVAAGWESIAIMRDRQLIFFRNRSADGEGTLADLVHQTAMYYEDRLHGSGFSRVMLCGAASGPEGEGMRHVLADRLNTIVEPIDPTRAAALTGKGGNAAWLQDALAPLVGLLLRTREAA
ncbi:MAG: pilus assembly protein PilM [Vicinamibacterales bacterium]